MYLLLKTPQAIKCDRKERAYLRMQKETIMYTTFVEEQTQRRFTETVLLRRINHDHTPHCDTKSFPRENSNGGILEI